MKKRGFTLIELMIVIAIIAILASIAIPALTGKRNHMFDRKDNINPAPGPAPTTNELIITVYDEKGELQNQMKVTSLSGLVENAKFLQDQAEQSGVRSEVVGQIFIRKSKDK